jgi:HAMP domain-containing protein
MRGDAEKPRGVRGILAGDILPHPDLKYIYTMRQVGPQVQFIVDADYGSATDPSGAIGDEYKEATETLKQGFGTATAEKDFYTDTWSTLLSGYAPLRNSKGDAIGLVGVDMSAEMVLQKQHFLGSTIYLIFGLGILVAGVVILIFSQTIIKDIKKLNRTATSVSQGDMNVVMDVKRKDEIGELADSFGRMVVSLKIMMANPDQSEVEFPHERAS